MGSCRVGQRARNEENDLGVDRLRLRASSKGTKRVSCWKSLLLIKSLPREAISSRVQEGSNQHQTYLEILREASTFLRIIESIRGVLQLLEILSHYR